MISRRRRHPDHTCSSRLDCLFLHVQQGVKENAKGKAVAAAGTTQGEVKGKAQELKGKAKGKAAQASGKKEELKGEAASTAEATKSKAASAAEDAKQTAQSTFETIKVGRMKHDFLCNFPFGNLLVQ